MGKFILELIESLDFDNEDIPVIINRDKTDYICRLTQSDINDMPNLTEDLTALRMRLSTLYHENFKSYAEFELKCNIKPNTFQKALKFRNGRNVTYIMLSKFCIGARLSVREAKELFLYTGYELNPRNRNDYIFVDFLDN